MKVTSRTFLLACWLTPIAALCYAGGHQAHKPKHSHVNLVRYASVEPILQANCVGCHNAARHPEEVDLSSYKAVMTSGRGGSIVMAGYPEKSKLIQYVEGSKKPRMPFRKAKLSNQKIHMLKKWIADGAKS